MRVRPRATVITIAVVLVLALAAAHYKNYLALYPVYFVSKLSNRTVIDVHDHQLPLPSRWWTIRKESDSTTLLGRLPLSRERNGIVVAVTRKTLDCITKAAPAANASPRSSDNLSIEISQPTVSEIETYRVLWFKCPDLERSCIDMAWDIPDYELRFTAFGINKPETESIADLITYLVQSDNAIRGKQNKCGSNNSPISNHENKSSFSEKSRQLVDAQ